MRELFLIRHAKSDWASEFLKDIDRPLNERGFRDAYFMSRWFIKNKQKPDLIISSTANRALSTALIFARTMEYDMKRFHLNQDIYECTVQTLLSVVQSQSDEARSLMIFCHNPCITDAFNKLNEDIFIDNVPTCGIVNLNFNVGSWKEVDYRKASVGFFQFPKDFRNNE
jgi:phosphohistidine phosphatase